MKVFLIHIKSFLNSFLLYLLKGLFFIFSQKITWITVGIIICLVLIKKCWFWYKKRQSESLVFQARKEIQKHAKDSGVNLKVWVENLYYPSWTSVIAVFMLTAILFCLAHFTHIWKFSLQMLQFDNSSHFQNLIAIHSGIGAVIFALLIFVAESLRDDDTKDRARVLLRESMLFPLTVLEITVFFVFGWWDVNALSLLSVLLVALLTIASLWRLLSVLLNKSRFNQKRLALLQDRINQEIHSAVEERYANNILLQGLGEEKIELSYNPFSLDGDETNGRQIFNSEKFGVITDIRLDKLKEFATIVEKEANNKGFSFYKNKVKKDSNEAGVSDAVVQTPVTTLQQKDREFIHKKYRDEVNEDYSSLLSIDLSVVNDPIVIAKLGALIKDIFVIKPADNFSEEIRLDVAGLRDQFISAIVEEKNGKVEDLAKTYIALAENFLKSISKYGGSYSYEQAKRERGDWFGGWNEIKWLVDDITEIYRKAVKSGDHSIIRTVAYLPVAIAIRAINYGDQYVYQEFLRFPSMLYWLSLGVEDEELKKFMVDRSWRHLKEMSDYYIENQLRRKANKPEQIEKYAEFTIPLFSAFQNLMKSAFEKKDIDAFNAFLESFTGMYEHFEFDDGYTAEHIRNQIQWTDDPADKKILEEKLALQEARDKVAKDIETKKQQIVFGLCAFIFDKYKNDSGNQTLKENYESISAKLPSDIVELTKLYDSSRNFDTERFWNWDDWEMIADGRVHIIDFSSKLDQLFTVKALLILQSLSDTQIAAISLPPSRDLAFMAEDRNDNRTLMSLIKKISENQAEWSFVLPQPAIDKVSALKALLEKVKADQESKEREFIKTVAISENKLKEFNEKIIDAFGEGSDLRKISNKLGAYSDKTSEKVGTTVPSIGYNQIDRKEAFIENWYVHYGGWGDQYGTGMARSEDQIVFEQMVNGLENQKNISKANIITEISEYVRASDFKNFIVIHTLGHITSYEIKQNPAFFDRYRRDCPTSILSGMDRHSGVLKIDDKVIPVVELFINQPSLKNKILIIDLEKFIAWTQYSPVDNVADEQFKDDIFFIKVVDLNIDDEQRNKIMTENPAWLNAHVDKEGYLRQHVVVKVYEKFKIEIKNPKAGICFTVASEVQEDD